jgi:hypothetical protein
MLVGTWEAAGWAIRFYRRHGFEQVASDRKRTLLKTYWTVPDRQINLCGARQSATRTELLVDLELHGAKR